mgnify:CR=1 FL=1
MSVPSSSWPLRSGSGFTFSVAVRPTRRSDMHRLAGPLFTGHLWPQQQVGTGSPRPVSPPHYPVPRDQWIPKTEFVWPVRVRTVWLPRGEPPSPQANTSGLCRGRSSAYRHEDRRGNRLRAAPAGRAARSRVHSPRGDLYPPGRAADFERQRLPRTVGMRCWK